MKYAEACDDAGLKDVATSTCARCNTGVARAVWRAHELARMAGRTDAPVLAASWSSMWFWVTCSCTLTRSCTTQFAPVRGAQSRGRRGASVTCHRAPWHAAQHGQGVESVAANPRHAPTPPTGEAAGWGWVRREGAHAGAAEEPVMRVTCPPPAHRLFGFCARDVEREHVVVLRRTGSRGEPILVRHIVVSSIKG